MKTHKDIDWEYVVESIAQRRYFSKCNDIDYSTLKDIAEEEVFYYMEHEEDTLRDMRNRISFRYRNKITHIMPYEENKFKGWRENKSFIFWYEQSLKENRYWRKLNISYL